MTRAGQAGIPGERRARKIEGQFVPRLVEMLESPAYRILSLSARRCLDRIEIEHIHHGGQENGQLPVTYDHFSEYGVHRHAIRRALRELAALGFIEITEQGVAGNAAHRAPNKFRLTYIRVGRVQPTHEWRHVKSTDDAEMIAKAARLGTNETSRKYRVQKQKPVPVSANHQCRIPITTTYRQRQHGPQIPSAGFHHYL
jgi:DNA-binding transcriptional regulator YhcF (GntR family)